MILLLSKQQLLASRSRFPKRYINQLVSLIIILTLSSLISSGCGGCNGCSSSDKPWEFVSKKAPYRLTISGRWKPLEAKMYNGSADFAVERGPLRAIIIPQQLDVPPGTRQPHSHEIEAASIQQMKKFVNDLVVEDEMQTFVGNNPATTVFAKGIYQNLRVFYLISFFVDKGWAYQIICWCPLEHRDAMTQAAKQLIAGWGRNNNKK